MINKDEFHYFLWGLGGLFAGAIMSAIFGMQGILEGINTRPAFALTGMCVGLYMAWSFIEAINTRLAIQLGENPVKARKQYRDRRLPVAMKALFTICGIASAAHLFYEFTGVI